MNILVTGGAGYVGAHTCKALKRRGLQPIVLDSLVRGHQEFVRWGPFIQGNIGDRDLVVSTIQKFNIKSVIHFAAFAYVGESVANPRQYYENNVTSSLALLGACLDSGVENIVFSSTCATYGVPSTVPINEKVLQEPINPYGFTKLVVEHALRDYAKSYGLNTIAFRYFNACGADSELEIGELHEPETHLIPLALRAALDPDYSLVVYGNDYDTPDGTCIRDYIHVEDLAEAHVRGITYLHKSTKSGKRGEFVPLNLGTSKGTSVLEIVSEIERLTGLRVKMKIGTRRPGDPPRLIAESSSAFNVLGWEPSKSSTTNIINTAWKWMIDLQGKDWNFVDE